MAVTDTLKSREAYEKAGFTGEQATTMGHMDEQHAGDVADYIRQIFAADFARLEGNLKADIQATRADLHSTIRGQMWTIIGFGFAIATIAVTVATLLRK